MNIGPVQGASGISACSISACNISACYACVKTDLFDVCQGIICLLAYGCGIFAGFVCMFLSVLESACFVGICCIVVGMDFVLSLEGVSIIIGVMCAGYLFIMTCIAWSIWILFSRGRRRCGTCRLVGGRRY